MAKTAVLAVKIISDSKDAVRGLGEVEGKASKMAGGLKLLAGGLTILAGATIGLIGKSVGDAAKLEQSIGAVDAVFKDSAGQMHEWSGAAADAVGLSKNEYNELATVLGAQLKNGGTAMDELGGKTNDLMGLGSDLSAMFGGTTADAVGALSSALKGERDPIEKYGVSLKQAGIDAKAAELGFEKVGGTLSSEAQQAATLALIMEQTSDAHGAFGRESDTLAHKQQVFGAKLENLSAKLGELFLPIASEVFGFLADVAVPALERLVDWLRPVGDFLGGFTDKLKGAKSPLEGLSGGAQALYDGFQQNILPAFQRAGDAIQGWVDKIRPIIEEITGAVLGKFREWEPTISEIFTSITEIIGGAIDLVVAIITPAIDYLSAMWDMWGDEIMAVVGVAFDNIVAGIKMALDVISGIIKTVTAIIKGDWRGAWEGIKQIVGAIFTGITTSIRNQLGGIDRIFGGALSRITGTASRAMGAVRNTIRSGIDAAVSFIRGLPSRAINAVSGMVGDFRSMGYQMIQGMINGVRAMAGRLASAARSVVRSAVNSAKSFLGIHSPSRLWASMGANTVLGYVQALDAGQRDSAKAGRSIAVSATDALAGVPVPAIPAAATAGGAGAGRGSTVINITVNGAVDPRGTADQLRRLLNNDARVRGVVDVGGLVVA